MQFIKVGKIARILKKISLLGFLTIIILLSTKSINALDLGRADEDGGRPGAYLSWGAGARSLGMGKAFVGLSDDSSATYWNPAGLTQLKRREFMVLYSLLWEDTDYGFISYIHPLMNKQGLDGKRLRKIKGLPRLFASGSLGIALVNLSSTGFEKTDELNNSLGKASDVETCGIISFGKKIGENEGLSCGISLKIVQQKIDTYSDSGFGLDLGFLYQLPIMNSQLPDLGIGLNIKNLISPRIKLDQDKDKFPIDVRLGIVYRIFRDKLRVAVDGDKTQGRSVKMHYGIEYIPFKKILDKIHKMSIRVGWDETEMTCGFGFEVSSLQIDYAYAYHDALKGYKDLGSSHRIGLSFRWDGNNS